MEPVLVDAVTGPRFNVTDEIRDVLLPEQWTSRFIVEHRTKLPDTSWSMERPAGFNRDITFKRVISYVCTTPFPGSMHELVG